MFHARPLLMKLFNFEDENFQIKNSEINLKTSVSFSGGPKDRKIVGIIKTHSNIWTTNFKLFSNFKIKKISDSQRWLIDWKKANCIKKSSGKRETCYLLNCFVFRCCFISNLKKKKVFHHARSQDFLKRRNCLGIVRKNNVVRKLEIDF